MTEFIWFKMFCAAPTEFFVFPLAHWGDTAAIGELYSGRAIHQFHQVGVNNNSIPNKNPERTANERTKHEKLHYKSVINHATYINYHCSMGPWTFIKLFGVFGALAA